jgi:CheY-like chemotaxis protein
MKKSRKAGPPAKTILIIDDEVGILEVVESILNDAGYKTVSALNGEEGLSRLEKTIPDLVMVDFMMPIMDGSGVIKAMRADERFRQIPVILTSALPEQSIKQRCEGYNAFLRKPFKTEALMEEISRLLDHGK